MNTANKLTVFRAILVPFFVLFTVTDFTDINRYIALSIFCIATVTDKLDGTIARKYNMITDFGKFMDPIADKLLVCSALICLTATNEIPAWITVSIISREFIVSALRLIASDNGVTIAASPWGKVKTIAQMTTIIVLLADIPALQTVETVIIYIALILTVISAIDYVAKNKKVLTFKSK